MFILDFMEFISAMTKNGFLCCYFQAKQKQLLQFLRNCCESFSHTVNNSSQVCCLSGEGDAERLMSAVDGRSSSGER